ncbi:MAG: extracellular solute-binding protein [Oscillospiraceae bacterium]|nr:extracellular solute-binding protein [Oscillospiraceae bacterium]
MNKIASRITAAVMAVGMALSLTSCGKKEVYASKDNIYSSQKVELPGGLDYINRMLYSNEKFYIVGDKSHTEGEGENMTYTSETLLQVVDLEGNLVKEAVLTSNDGTSNSSRYISSLNMDNDGNLVAIESSYEWNETTGESKEGYFVKKFNTDGELLSELDLTKFSEAVKKETGQDWFYPENFTFANDGTMLISSNSMIFGVDDNGGIKYVIKNEAANENSWMGGMYKAGDGRIFTMFSTGRELDGEYVSESKLYEIDCEKQQLGAEYVYEMNGQIMNGTDEHDLLITRDSGLVGYDIETGESEVIIDWLKSGIDTTAMDSNGTTVLPDGRILCLTYEYDFNGGGYSWSTDDLVINILTKVDPADIPDKKLIKIYALYLDVGVKRQIVEFNKTNEMYKIELTSYDDYATKSYDEALKRMNNDMISGNIPDIIVLNNELPVDSYISKGLLADLYQFMDKDETINKEDYLTNIFDAYSVDGKLYELVPSFNITTLVGKSSIVGEEPGWTMDEFIALADTHPEAMVFGYEMTRDNVFMTLVSNCYDSYIDTATGKCNFNSDDFIKLLEFSSRFPKEIDWDTLYEDDNYWMEQETRFRDNKALVMDQYMSNFRTIREMEMGNFGEPITFKGYPGAKGNGAAIDAYTSIAITAKAANPDGAWEFIKYFLSDEYQNELEWQYPIKISALEAQMEKAKKRPFWVDENGEKQYYDNTYYIGGQEIKIGENTDEDNQRVLDLIKSTTNVSRYDRDIYKIIEEEAAPFFEGQKTAKEVADIIQNRVSNYIAENM